MGRQSVVDFPAPVRSELLPRAQAAPRLFTQSYLSRPQGQQWLPCLLGVCGAVRPLPLPTFSAPSHPLSLPRLSFPSFMAGIWKPFLFIYCIVLCSSERNPQSPCRAISEGCMRSSQLFAGSGWARLHQCSGGVAICALGSSWAVCVSGMEAVRVLSVWAVVLASWCFSFLLSDLR